MTRRQPAALRPGRATSGKGARWIRGRAGERGAVQEAEATSWSVSELWRVSYHIRGRHHAPHGLLVRRVLRRLVGEEERELPVAAARDAVEGGEEEEESEEHNSNPCRVVTQRPRSAEASQSLFSK